MLTSGRTLLRVALLALLSTTCTKAPYTAPTGSTMFLQANPQVVLPSGGQSVVTAFVTDPTGRAMADGVAISFFTDLGSINSVGTTSGGVARVTFISDGRLGAARITALSGKAVDTTTIVVANPAPARVVVAADPQHITSPRSALLTAIVYDANGFALPNVPVAFQISGTKIEETLDSGGLPAPTDGSGRVIDTLRTNAATGSGVKTITVTATTPTGVVGTVTVSVSTTP